MAKKEITKRMASDYLKASKKKKGTLLNNVCAITGWSRDNARRQLKHAIRLQSRSKAYKRATKPLKYSAEARQVLINAWVLSGMCCGQYLACQIQEGLLDRLLLHKSLHRGRSNKGPLLETNDPVLDEIRSMSSATIDRYLQNARAQMQPLAKSTTKPASYVLRNEIPFGKSYTLHETPGWLSTDTVAHCGESLKGDHIWTLNSTDVVSGWTETISIKSRASCFVKEGHEELLPRFPFPILGVNYDGGSEFINQTMIDYAKLQHYQMTRSRPYHSNDNAHVEQKNADIVRRYAFRYRYNGDDAMKLLNDLWFWVNIRKNYLIPTKKCMGHKKTKSGRTVGVYDKPTTPAKRLLAFSCVSEEDKKEFSKLMLELNDAEITKAIYQLQEKLLTLALDSHLLEYIKQEIQQVVSA